MNFLYSTFLNVKRHTERMWVVCLVFWIYNSVLSRTWVSFGTPMAFWISWSRWLSFTIWSLRMNVAQRLRTFSIIIKLVCLFKRKICQATETLKCFHFGTMQSRTNHHTNCLKKFQLNIIGKRKGRKISWFRREGQWMIHILWTKIVLISSILIKCFACFSLPKFDLFLPKHFNSQNMWAEKYNESRETAARDDALGNDFK